MIAQAVGRPDAEIIYAERRPGDVVRLQCDGSKAKKLLGFKTTVTLRDGLVRLRDWYASEGKSAEELLKQERLLNWVFPDASGHP
jgi:nucleoside-diphosphate-sugar epimerase